MGRPPTPPTREALRLIRNTHQEISAILVDDGDQIPPDVRTKILVLEDPLRRAVVLSELGPWRLSRKRRLT
jgi:hypothetical protein